MLTFLDKFKATLTVGTLAIAVVVNTVRGTPTPGKPITLAEAFQRAVEKTETVPLQEVTTRQVEERISQANGRLLPNINLLATYLRQDTSNEGGATAGFTRPDQSNVRIGLLQPLFRGFGEFAELNSRKASLDAQRATEGHTKLALYSTVAQSYFNALMAERDAKNLRGLLDLTKERVKELKGRSRIGRSRKGELLAAEAQVATLDSQIQAAELTIERSREDLELVSGVASEESLADIQDEMPPALPGLGILLAVIEGRPDVEAAKARVTAADESTTVARAGHFPSLDLTANYYIHRTGVLGDSKWDLGVQLTLPIFQGGVVQSQFREATLKRKEMELQLSKSRREAMTEIRSLYKTLTSQILQQKTLKQALQIAEDNYTEQRRDYRYGLATHLEVLQAMNAFQETKRLMDRTRYQALASYASLRAATGQAP